MFGNQPKNKQAFPYTDHLGNIRLSYAWDEAYNRLKILKENNYYPFGLKHGQYNAVKNTAKLTRQNTKEIRQMPLIQEKYKYEYNGKEFQEELGLNITFMDFRQYDNMIGRFYGIDRMTEKVYGITPYRFGFNNPILFSDPTGLWEWKKGGWYTENIKDINRFMNMLWAEFEMNGSVSGAQIDLFIKEEFQGSGGRLSDGSALLDAETLSINKKGKSSGFSPRQIFKLQSQITNFTSNPYNEKSFNWGSFFEGAGHWAYTYRYYRERNYYANGGQGFSSASLGGFVTSLVSDFMHNKQFWMGKNLKFYDVSWGGNQFTGGKNKFAKKWSSLISKSGYVFTLYSMLGTADEYSKGKLNGLGATYLLGVDTAGARNLYTAAWSFGTSLGKALEESNWWFNMTYKDYNW